MINTEEIVRNNIKILSEFENFILENKNLLETETERLFFLIERINDYLEQSNINKKNLFVISKVQLQEIDKSYLSVNLGEKIANGFRLFLVMLTSGIGIVLGLASYSLLHIIFNLFNTLFLSSAATIAGTGIGIFSLRALSKETSLAITNAKLLYLKEIALKKLEENLNEELVNLKNKFKELSIGEDIYPHEEIKNISSKNVNRSLCATKNITLTFKFWLIENCYSVISNTSCVTIGNFAGNFVIPGLLINAAKGLSYAPLALIVAGPYGIIIGISLAAAICLLVGGLFLYGQYKNAIRNNIVDNLKSSLSNYETNLLTLNARLDEKRKFLSVLNKQLPKDSSYSFMLNSIVDLGLLELYSTSTDPSQTPDNLSLSPSPEKQNFEKVEELASAPTSSILESSSRDTSHTLDNFPPEKQNFEKVEELASAPNSSILESSSRDTSHTLDNFSPEKQNFEKVEELASAPTSFSYN